MDRDVTLIAGRGVGKLAVGGAPRGERPGWRPPGPAARRGEERFQVAWSAAAVHTTHATNGCARTMNIVYGVSGEGLGHVFEAVEVATRLKGEGHNVRVLTYGERACALLRDFNPTRIAGINLHFNREGMSLVDTTLRKPAHFPVLLAQLAPAEKGARCVPARRVHHGVRALQHVRLARPRDAADQHGQPERAPARAARARGPDVRPEASAACDPGLHATVRRTTSSSPSRSPKTARRNVHFVSPVIQTVIRRLRAHRRASTCSST